MDASELLLLLNIVVYAHYAPYTKVEESFNLQACFDFLNHGIGNGLKFWDHRIFPGVVPRSFLGSIIVSALAYVPISVVSFFRSPTGLAQQLAVRIILGGINAAALISLKRTITKVHGSVAGNFFIALQGTQFHSCLVQSEPYKAIILLTVATVIFRGEILTLLGTTVLWHFIQTHRVTFWKTARLGLLTGLSSAVISGTIDSYLWQYPVLPELSGFIFNVMHGKSSNWGTSPWYQYAFDILKLLLNPVALPLIGYGAYSHRKALDILIPALAFCTIYSLQPHKEWRFIVYVVPGLTFIASLGSAHLFTRRAKHVLYRLSTIVVLASIPCTALLSHGMGLISAMNYPGGEMMQKVTALPGHGPIYLDVTTCMTGSSKFLRGDEGAYDRTEDESVLATVEFWDKLRYASVSHPAVIKSLDERWRVVDRVWGYDGVDVRGLRISKAIKLYLMENLRPTPATFDARQKQSIDSVL
ncbi:protein of unknown function [Taphrina deformans PYCC 5710]|uniref:Mannosyltransferase n=1 Tax=Taphrina deformans (strain PYCC 5710 / ATCC 11124 / CBS 356.35 / IMI 108563 / JCM 9778 / NBRC 8474) TaxID=1097556 RepID=R4XFA6_TAPDE|nr:protein of unknown function [Taphrina deformans PYCC 5710]|eukprot:CCG84348.1 protein of unknown function [Taphrina deformans PYCC 5710]